MKGPSVNIILSNRVKLTVTRTGPDTWQIFGIEQVERTPNGQLVEPYTSEVRTAVEIFSEAIRQNVNAGTATQDHREPPKIAEFLLTALLSRARADALTGDLEERFTRDCEELGRRRAVRLYWARTLRSLWPLLRRATAKALKWGAVIATVRRMF
jgi:hypothetical protein